MPIFGHMNFYDFFLRPYQTYTTLQIFLEAAGTIFGILSVYFSVRKNIWVYPTGIVSTIIYVYLLFNFGLLGDCMINLYYTVMSIYGWVLWSKSSEDKLHVQVGWATKKEWAFAVLLFMLSLLLVTVVYYLKPAIMNHFSLNGVQLGLSHLDWANWLDVLTTAIFLVGMWLMAERKIENWLFWIIGDMICVPMMVYKGLGITSLQYILFTAMAMVGFVKWRKDYYESSPHL